MVYMFVCYISFWQKRKKFAVYSKRSKCFAQNDQTLERVIQITKRLIEIKNKG
jgi:hypothetical protein